MSQSAPQGNAPRRATPSPTPSDLDALLESLQPEPRTPGVPPAPTTSSERSDPTARRVQALIRAFDVLHRQVGAIASQGETISKVAESQARDSKAIADLQRNMRYMRAIVIQLLQQGGTSSQHLPPMQIKLVVGHLVEQYQQAERDAAVLSQWAMLFVGFAAGMGCAALVSAVMRVLQPLMLFGAVALITLLVSFIFWGLARSARGRAAAARRVMDESTLLRNINPGTTSEPV